MDILEIANIGCVMYTYIVYIVYSVYTYLNIYTVIAFSVHIISLIYRWGRYGHTQMKSQQQG